MRRTIISFVCALALTPLLFVSGQTPNANSRMAQSDNQAAKPKARTLVNKLPAGAQGVTLKNNAVRLKPGYKFVKQDDGTIAVARIRGGGLGVGGTWNCSCWSGTGGCEAYIVGDTISCLKKDCTGSCQLSIVIKDVKTGVVMY